MTTLVDLSQNIALLFSLTFLYGFIYPRLERLAERTRSILNGLLFGSFAVISMTMPIQVQEGVFYDGRTIVICIAGIYGGVIPALITAVLVGLYRISIGGIGTASALVSATCAALIGIGLNRYYQRQQRRPQARILLLAGLAVALIGMSLAMLVPGLGLNVVRTTFPTTIIVYPLGMMLLGLLINDQRRNLQMERALRDNERRFHAIFNSAFQFISLLTPDGTILEVNQTALDFGGMHLADVVKRPLWEVPAWAASAETQATLKNAIRRAANGEFVRYEADVAGANEHRATLDFSLKPLHDEEGQVVLLIAEGRDISTIKALEQEKVSLVLERERARLLKKFISDVSHDLRTPLSVIRLNLELLRRTSDPQKQQMRIETLAGQEQHLTRLLTDMMIMLSLDDEQSAFTFKPLDLNFVTQLAFDTYHSAAQRKQQKLSFNRSSDALRIEADQVEMERALAKLLDNALAYTPTGGTITLTTSQEDGSAVIEIRDSGIGISADDLPNIWQRFFRADQARSMDTGGTGLGLPIARKIVEAHGGSIEVESAPEAGSTFRVRIPLGITAKPGAARLTVRGSAI